MSGVTAKDIAARLGLSASAVSLALNGKPGVSERTRVEVLEAAAEMGYSSLRLPAASAQRRRLCFVFYVNKLVSIAENTTFSSFVLQGVEAAASALGYSTQVRYLRASESIEKQAADICRATDGIILLGTDVTEKNLPELEAFFTAAAAMPLVVVDCPLLAGRFDSVENDNYGGVRMAVQYLIKRGCRRVGYLRSRHRIENFEGREAGLRAALREAWLELDTVVDCGISFDEANADMNRFLKSGRDMPAAFFAENDIIAAAAIRALRANGVDLPGRVSIIGFDDIPICDLTDPTLTTVRSFKEQLGETAVNLLHSRLADRAGVRVSTGSGLLRVTVSTELHIRDSVR